MGEKSFQDTHMTILQCKYVNTIMMFYNISLLSITLSRDSWYSGTWQFFLLGWHDEQDVLMAEWNESISRTKKNDRFKGKLSGQKCSIMG